MWFKTRAMMPKASTNTTAEELVSPEDEVRKPLSHMKYRR